MHSAGKLVRNAAYNVAENSFSAVGVKLYPYYLFVGNSQLLSVGRGKVNMSFSNDNPLFHLYLAAGTYKLAARRTRNVAAFAYGSGNSYRTCVGCGKLYLSGGTYRTKD